MRLYIDYGEKEFLYKNFTGQTRNYAVGSLILQTYEAGNHLGFLIEGVTKQTLVNSNGKERIMLFNKPISVFGETSIFIGKKSLPDLAITAITPAKVIFIEKEQVERKLQEDPEISLFLLKVMAKKSASLIHHLNMESFHDSLSIICEILLALEENNSEIHTTHEEIAEIISRNRVTVSRALSKLRQLGVIEQKKGSISIMKPHILKQIITGEYADLTK